MARMMSLAEIYRDSNRNMLSPTKKRLRVKSTDSGTVVIAIEFKDGILAAADRQASSDLSNKVVSLTMKKLTEVTHHSVIGAAGSVGFIQSVNDRYFRLLNQLQRDNVPSPESQIIILHKFISQLSSLSQAGCVEAEFLFAGVNPDSGSKIIVEIDSSASRMDRESFAAIGSGWVEASTSLRRYFQRWRAKDTDENTAIHLALEAVSASAIDKGVGDPKISPPTVAILTKDGVRILEDDEVKRVVKEVSA